VNHHPFVPPWQESVPKDSRLGAMQIVSDLEMERCHLSPDEVLQHAINRAHQDILRGALNRCTTVSKDSEMYGFKQTVIRVDCCVLTIDELVEIARAARREGYEEGSQWRARR
jgi:hypothetical protein